MAWNIATDTYESDHFPTFLHLHPENKHDILSTNNAQPTLETLNIPRNTDWEKFNIKLLTQINRMNFKSYALQKYDAFINCIHESLSYQHPSC